MIIKANRNTSECVAQDGRLYAPDQDPQSTTASIEFISAYVLDVVFQAGTFKGTVITSTGARHPVRLTSSLHLGCCDFNKAETARLRKWARENSRG